MTSKFINLYWKWRCQCDYSLVISGVTKRTEACTVSPHNNSLFLWCAHLQPPPHHQYLIHTMMLSANFKTKKILILFFIAWNNIEKKKTIEGSIARNKITICSRPELTNWKQWSTTPSILIWLNTILVIKNIIALIFWSKYLCTVCTLYSRRCFSVRK